MRNFRLFQQARCEVIVILQVYKLQFIRKWIRTGIRTLEAQVDEKNKNIEARQNVTGSYKKRVQCKWKQYDFYVESSTLFSIQHI